MSFFKRITHLFSGSRPGDQYAYWITVKCNRCGEIIRSRVDLRNDLSLDYGTEESQPVYFCRKTLMGDSAETRCFQRVEVELSFDKERHLLDRQISGGQFVDEAEPSG